MTEVMECNFCDKPATKFVVGWVDGGPGGEGYGIQPVCNEHVKPFEDWDGKWGSDELHGFLYLTGIFDTFEEAGRA